MAKENRRIRDPIHGLIVFDLDNAVDTLAWELIQTKEFQRLRRIRQLGVSELVYPCATHTRFAHSIGVFHNARKLIKIVQQKELDFDVKRANEVLIAALLHDLGHGPFSHAFEGAREALADRQNGDPIEKHEKFTEKIILNPDGEIFPLLDNKKFPDSFNEGFANNVATLVGMDNPADIYHAVVSSSFDADRLDYLERDRYMTGTKTGAIDYDWLIDNLTTRNVDVVQDNDDESTPTPTFVFKLKGRAAAEDFLLARFRLFTQVYLHKTTRGFEKLISALVEIMGDPEFQPKNNGLISDHPLLMFLKDEGDALTHYLALDDFIVWAVFEQLVEHGEDVIARLAACLVQRQPLKSLDVTSHYKNNATAVRDADSRLQNFLGKKLGKTVFRDKVNYNLYSQTNGEAEKAHKTLRVLDSDGAPCEIQTFAESIVSDKLTKDLELIRYYFMDSDLKAKAEKHMKEE